MRGKPLMDLLASPLSHQVPLYFSWRADPQYGGGRSSATLGKGQPPVRFPTFLFDKQSVKENKNGGDRSGTGSHASLATTSLVQ